MSLEVFLKSGVKHLDLERGSVRQPVTEEQLAAVHAVAIGVFQIEDAHSGLLWGQGLDQVGPVVFSFSVFLEDLDRRESTTLSLSTL